MKKRLHNISLIHIPFLSCSQRQEYVVVTVTAGKDRTVSFIFEIILPQNLSMPTHY